MIFQKVVPFQFAGRIRLLNLNISGPAHILQGLRIPQRLRPDRRVTQIYGSASIVTSPLPLLLHHIDIPLLLPPIRLPINVVLHFQLNDAQLVLGLPLLFALRLQMVHG